MNRDREILGFTPYQWLVLLAAWLGFGFDVFDGLLFNYVARLCVPSLLGPEANNAQVITNWTGIMTSVLLVGWAIGGIYFGKIADRLGRTNALMITMLTYALATAACALAPNIWALAVFRFIAALGIGGEWAAGAALVSESVPDKRRVTAGALLYTCAPAGLFLATFVTDLFTRKIEIFASNPELAWRLVFLTGLIPAAIAVGIRLLVKEPEGWIRGQETPKIRELFSLELRRKTTGGLAIVTVALITWWTCNAFTPAIASFLVSDLQPAPDPQAIPALKASYVTIATTWFNLGGLIGTLVTIPAAIFLGRRRMYLVYFVLSAMAVWIAYGFPLAPEMRLRSFFLVGLFVFGIFGSFPFYLPELFPARLRGTGCGFCYNVGRFITAIGPFVVGQISAQAKSSADILQVVSWVAVVPAVGAVAVILGVGEETSN